MEILSSTPNCVYCGNQLQPFEVTENINDKLPECMARPVCYHCWDQMEKKGIQKTPCYDWNIPQTLSVKLIT